MTPRELDAATIQANLAVIRHALVCYRQYLAAVAAFLLR